MFHEHLFFMKSSVKFTAPSSTKSALQLQKLGNQVLLALYFYIFLSAHQYTTSRFLAMINFQSLLLPSFLTSWQFCECVKILIFRTHWSNVFKNILQLHKLLPYISLIFFSVMKYFLFTYNYGHKVWKHALSMALIFTGH